MESSHGIELVVRVIEEDQSADGTLLVCFSIDHYPPSLRNAVQKE